MNVDQISTLRDSYMVESTRPDGRKSTTGEYMRFITDCNIEFVTSKDLVVTDDAKEMVHCVCLNEDVYSQADFPVKIISAPYEDIHSIETIMSRENFEKFLNSGFFNQISEFSTSKKEFMLKWAKGIKIQAQQESKVNPYYSQEPTIIPMGRKYLNRNDGIVEPTAPASLSPSVAHIDASDEAGLIDGIKAGAYVTLTQDVALTEDSITINDNTTIDMNGHTITGVNSKRTFVVNKGNVVFKNGTIVATGNDALFLNAVTEDGGAPCTLTLGEDVTVIADDCCVFMKGPGATLNTAANMTSNGNYAAIQGNGAHGGITVNITSGEIVSKDIGVYFPCKTALNISGNAKISGSTGIYVKSGNITINGGEITATGNKVEYEHNPNGCNSTGDALVIEACDYPDGVPVVNIAGGIFNSANASSVAYYQQSEEYALKNTKFITGGTFNTDVSEFVVDGYTLENNTIVKA